MVYAIQPVLISDVEYMEAQLVGRYNIFLQYVLDSHMPEISQEMVVAEDGDHVEQNTSLGMVMDAIVGDVLEYFMVSMAWYFGKMQWPRGCDGKR